MLILNTGGTFNKRYNPISGTLEVPFDNDAIEKILEHTGSKYSVAGVLYKDSLEMDGEDRKQIANIIIHSNEEAFVVVHGTDTMHLSAEFLAHLNLPKKIVFTGAMVPFSIDKVEAASNLNMAIGFLSANPTCGVYICMSGVVASWEKIVKNKEQGRFEVVS